MEPLESPTTPYPTLASSAAEPSDRSLPAYPYTSIALIVAAAFPVRFNFAFSVFGSFTLLDVTLAAVALRTLLGLLGSGARIRLGDARVATLITVPFLVCVVSLIWTEDVTATLRAIGVFGEAIAAYWVVTNAFGGLTSRQLMARAGLFTMLLLSGSVASLLQVPGFGPPSRDLVTGSAAHVAYLAAYYARLGNPFYGLSNDFASVLVLYLFPLLAWGVATMRRSYSVLAGVTFAAVVLTLSRGVIIATVIGGLVFLLTERRRIARWLPAIALGSTLLLTVGYLYYQISEVVRTYFLDRLSLTNVQARQEIIAVALRRIADAPLLGYGAGVVSDPILADGVHNTYLQQALYFGIPLGLLCAGALWLLAARFLFLPMSTQRARVLAIAFGVSTLIQLALFLVETSFEATLPKTAFYSFLAFGGVVLAQISRETGPRLQPLPEERATR